VGGLLFVGYAARLFYREAALSAVLGYALFGLGFSLRGTTQLTDENYKQSVMMGVGAIMSLVGIALVGWKAIGQ
jgi:hypothetical protein